MSDIVNPGELLSLDALRAIIKDVESCLKNKGLELPEIDINIGVGNILATLILQIDHGIANAMKVVVELYKIYKELKDAVASILKGAVDVVNKIIKRLTDFIQMVQEIVENVVKWIINKILKAFESFAYPISLDLSFLIPGFPKLKFDAAYKKLSKKLRDSIDSAMTAPGWMQAMIDQMMLPINMIVGFFKQLIDKVVEIVTLIKETISNIVGKITELIEKIAKFVTDFVTNVVKTIMDMFKELLQKLLKPIALPLLKRFLPDIPDVDFNKYITDIMKAIGDILEMLFSFKLPDFKKYLKEIPHFDKVWGIIGLILCFITATIGIIQKLPTLLFG